MPAPNNKTETTNAIRMCETFHPNLPDSHSETPKIIYIHFKINGTQNKYFLRNKLSFIERKLY